MGLTSPGLVSHVNRSGCPVLLVLLSIQHQLTIFVNETIIEPELSLGMGLEADHLFKRESVALSAQVQPQPVDLMSLSALGVGCFVTVESHSHELLLSHHLQLASQVGDGCGIGFQDKLKELVPVSMAFEEG